MRTKSQNRIISFGTLLTLMLGLILSCRAAFSPAPVLAISPAVTHAITETKITANDFGSCFVSDVQTHQKDTTLISKATMPITGSGNSSPSCCFGRTIPNQTTSADQNFFKKPSTLLIAWPTVLPPPQPNLSFILSAIDPPIPLTLQLTTIVKRE